MKAIACYVYAGNFSLGVSRHMDVLAHCEDPKPYGLDVIELNRARFWPNLKVYAGPLNWPVVKDLDLIFANPPCAAFSNANTRSYSAGSYQKDERCQCWYRVMEQIDRCRPKMFAVESVCQMYVKAPAMVREMVEKTQAMGYRPHIFFHNACFMGSCQNRKRLLLIGTQKELSLAEYQDTPRVTVNDVLKQAAKLTGEVTWSHSWASKLQPLIDASEPGGHLSDIWKRLNPVETAERNSRGNLKGCPSFGLVRLRGDELCPTIMAYPLVHPTENRFIHLGEHKVLADFPIDYMFPRGTSSYHYCGSGVSSKVGEWLAKTVALTLASKKKVGSDLDLRIIDGLRGKAQEVTTVIHAADEYPHVSVGVQPRSVPKRVALTVGGVAVNDFANGTFDVKAKSAPTPKRQAAAAPVQKFEQTTMEFEKPRPVQPRSNPMAPTAREDRFDRSQLKLGSKGMNCHRDYSAHFFRWSFLRRYVERNAVILDVGCGQEVPLMHLLTDGVQGHEPKMYVGVDLNAIRKKPERKNATILDEFNVLERWKELEQYEPYDAVSCLEVLEHMHVEDGHKLLKILHGFVGDGRLFLSTPVFNGKAARAHLHEYTVDELQAALTAAGFTIEHRFGTFMNMSPGIKKQLDPTHRGVIEQLSCYYDNDALSCFLAPLYPDLARNNLWICRRSS